MASVVAGGLFNAVAFAGAGFLFSKLNHSGYSAEMKRHNKAIEDLAAAKEKFNEAEVKRNDKIRERREELYEANKDIQKTNRALDEYKRAMEKVSIVHDGVRFNSEPRLDQFYKLSDEMKNYKTLFILGLISASAFGFVLSRYY